MIFNDCVLVLLLLQPFQGLRAQRAYVFNHQQTSPADPTYTHTLCCSCELTGTALLQHASATVMPTDNTLSLVGAAAAMTVILTKNVEWLLKSTQPASRRIYQAHILSITHPQVSLTHFRQSHRGNESQHKFVAVIKAPQVALRG